MQFGIDFRAGVKVRTIYTQHLGDSGGAPPGGTGSGSELVTSHPEIRMNWFPRAGNELLSEGSRPIELAD